jgi:ubiquinone/menaquinone biosynthesis C-methylase UbiE
MTDRKSSRTRGAQKTEVPAAFDAGAAAYDGLVDANPGYHRHLRISAERMRLVNGGKGLRLLDAGCGTGASTAALLSVAPQADIVAVDASSGMLAEAAAKDWPASVRFVHSRIEDIAEAGVEGPFDGIFAAYLLRNLKDPDAQLREFLALLRPGATPGSRRPCGTRYAPRSSSRWASCAAGMPASTATYGAASTNSTARQPS